MLDAERPYRWLAQYLVERFAPASVLDLGCGFGKLALALKRQDPRLQVTGVELSAPLLRLAHLRSLEAGLEMQWLQAAAEAVPLPATSVDGVASYWLFHELPVPAMHQVIREAWRLLRPGGFFASYDMHTAAGGTVGECLHVGHAARNNEPYLPGLLATDMRQALQAAGFTEVELVDALTGAPATDSSGALAATRTHSFTVAIGRKPA
jgi:ubiquinone/menaquinone biosynthesis C-methylase UbiE